MGRSQESFNKKNVQAKKEKKRKEKEQKRAQRLVGLGGARIPINSFYGQDEDVKIISINPRYSENIINRFYGIEEKFSERYSKEKFSERYSKLRFNSFSA